MQKDEKILFVQILEFTGQQENLSPAGLLEANRKSHTFHAKSTYW